MIRDQIRLRVRGVAIELHVHVRDRVHRHLEPLLDLADDELGERLRVTREHAVVVEPVLPVDALHELDVAAIERTAVTREHVVDLLPVDDFLELGGQRLRHVVHRLVDCFERRPVVSDDRRAVVFAVRLSCSLEPALRGAVVATAIDLRAQRASSSPSSSTSAGTPK